MGSRSFVNSKVGYEKSFSDLLSKLEIGGTHTSTPKRFPAEPYGNPKQGYFNPQWESHNRPIEETYAGSMSGYLNPEWEQHNRPIDNNYWPSDEPNSNAEQGPDNAAVNRGPFDEDGHVDEHSALLDLENTYKALELPVINDIHIEIRLLVINLAIQFVFRCYNWLNDFRLQLPQSIELYDQHALAMQFYSDYGATLWRNLSADQRLHERYMTRLENFFRALRTQNAVRSDDSFGEGEVLKRFNALWRVGISADPSASLIELYILLDIPNTDNLLELLFRRAVAQMTFEALDHVRDAPMVSFPCSRPSDGLVRRLVERIIDRYAQKLWSMPFYDRVDEEKILRLYILVLIRSDVPRKEVGDGSIQMLDIFLDLKDGDAEERSSRDKRSQDQIVDLECPLKPSAEFDSCLERFVSTIDLAAHMVEVHEWDSANAEEIAEDVAQS